MKTIKMSMEELINLSEILKKAANTLQENIRSLERNFASNKLVMENSNLKDEVNRLRIGHKELKEKVGNEKHRADMLEVALTRKNIKIDMTEKIEIIKDKEELKEIIINDLERHLELIKFFYKPDIDACNKLVSLVHQASISS